MASDRKKIDKYYQQQIDALNEILNIQEQQISDKYDLKENIVQTLCEKIYKEILRNKTNETKFQEELGDLKANLQKISKEKKDQDQDLQLKSKQITAKENEIARLKQQINETEEKINELSSTQEQKDRKIESLETDKKKHRQLIDQIEDQINTLVQQLHLAQNKNEQLEKQIKEITSNAINLGSKQFSIFEHYTKSLEHRFLRVANKFNSYQQNQSKIHESLMLKQKNLFEKLQLIDQVQIKNQSFTPRDFFNAFENLLGVYEALRKKATDYQQSFELNDKTLKFLEERARTKELELDILNKQHEFQIQEKLKQIEALEWELSKTQERFELEESNNKDLKKQHEELRIKYNDFVSQMTLEQSQLVHAHSQELIKQRNELRDLYEKELLQKQEIIFNLEKELRMLIRQKEELKGANQELEDEISEKTKKIKSLSTQNNELLTTLELKEEALRKMRRDLKENMNEESRNYLEMKRTHVDTGANYPKANLNYTNNESTASKFVLNSTKKTNLSTSKDKPYLEMLEEIEKAAKQALEEEDDLL